MEEKKEKPKTERSVKIFWGTIAGLFLAFIVCMIFLQIYLSWYHNSEGGTRKRLKENWGITLPESAEMVYQINYLELDKYYYSVFTLTEEETELLSDLSDAPNEEFAAVFESHINFIQQKTGEEISASYLFGFENAYLWLESGEERAGEGSLQIVFSPEDQLLYIYDSDLSVH